ncbi:MAG: hypothetical protein AAGG09_01600 [Pseudomonadota bacterium]
MAWSVPYTLLIFALLAAPSLVARGVHIVTGDPLWQYLAIDEERIAAAETYIETDGPHIRVRVYWRGADDTYATPEELVEALRGSFAVKGIEAFIAVMEPLDGSNSPHTTIELRAGANKLGPFPAYDAARHIQPAVKAAHLAYRPASTEEHRW